MFWHFVYCCDCAMTIYPVVVFILWGLFFALKIMRNKKNLGNKSTFGSVLVSCAEAFVCKVAKGCSEFGLLTQPKSTGDALRGIHHAAGAHRLDMLLAQTQLAKSAVRADQNQAYLPKEVISQHIKHPTHPSFALKVPSKKSA